MCLCVNKHKQRFNTGENQSDIPGAHDSSFSDLWSSERSGFQLQLLETNAPGSILAFSE